jgi:sigma54-dependent transcription regulator
MLAACLIDLGLRPALLEWAIDNGATVRQKRGENMLTNFTFKVNDIMRLDGRKISSTEEAIRDWMSFAQSQVDLLKAFVNLDEVLTLDDIPRIHNANLILHQIHDRLMELEGHFTLTSSSSVFQKATEKLHSLKEEAETLTLIVMKYVPKVMSLTEGE